MLDNCSVAIMNMTNELAGRHGIRPYDFVAVLNGEGEQIELRFESPPDSDKAAAFDRMLTDIGVSDAADSVPGLQGTEETIYAALESALRRAPKQSRTR